MCHVQGPTSRYPCIADRDGSGWSWRTPIPPRPTTTWHAAFRQRARHTRARLSSGCPIRQSMSRRTRNRQGFLPGAEPPRRQCTACPCMNSKRLVQPYLRARCPVDLTSCLNLRGGLCILAEKICSPDPAPRSIEEPLDRARKNPDCGYRCTQMFGRAIAANFSPLLEVPPKNKDGSTCNSFHGQPIILGYACRQAGSNQ